MAVHRRVRLAVLAVCLVAAIAGQARAAPAALHRCGDLPATRTHNDITDITARNTTCRTARRVSLRAFRKCARSGCHVRGGWTCSVHSRGEAITYRCVRGRRVVKAHTGA